MTRVLFGREHVPLDHHDRGPDAELGRGEEAPLGEAAALDLHVAVVRPEHRHDLRVHPLVLHLLEQLHPDPGIADVGETRERLGLLRLDYGADAHFLGQRVRVERGRGPEPQDVERGRPRDLDGVDDLVPDPLHDGRHRHHRGHADDHAQDRERGAQLVGPQLVERDEPAFRDRPEPHAALPNAE